MRINFDFTDLDAFLAVYETGSFQRASEQLAISQSAVTRRIQKLEAALDAALFERTTRRLHPTLAASEFRARAQGLRDDAQEALRVLGDAPGRHGRQRNAVVTVATVPTLTQDLIPRVLARFQREGFRARIHLLDLLAGEVGSAVAAGEADFGIGFGGMSEPGLVFEWLRDDRFVVAFNPGHPLAQHDAVSWPMLAPHPLIVPQKGGGNRLLIDVTLARQQLQLDWAYQARHSSTLLELVRAGLGVALLPGSALGVARDSELSSRPLIEPSISRALGVIRRGSHVPTRMATALLEILQDECRRVEAE